MISNLLSKLNLVLIFLLYLFSTIVTAQTETVYIDFGNSLTPAPWNSTLSNSDLTTTINLTNSNNISTGIGMRITDAFPGSNSDGTTAPDAGLNFPSSATRDSFYGSGTDGGAFLFTNLVVGKTYTITFFASKMGVIDNREASYTVIGASSQTVHLNPTGNTSTTVTIVFQPKTDGTAELKVDKGPANNNSAGYFYIGLIKLQYDTATPTYTNNALQIDFGANTSQTAGNWNNLTVSSTAGSLNNLVSKGGTVTNINLAVTDSFNFYNDNGTTAAGQSLGLPTTATSDSFFGNTVEFEGKVEPSGAIKYSNFNPNVDLSLTFYASRMDYVNIDNRQTKYTIEGLTTETVYLNIANNINNSVSKSIKPKADGTLTITVSKGPNNTNVNGFFYLGAMLIDYAATPSIAINSPNGNEFWQVGKTTTINWTASSLANPITLEYSINNGQSWNLISNSVPSTNTTYDWIIPNTISTNCLVRATSTSVQDSSDGVFEISSDSSVNTIVVIGSSTAEGIGASELAKSWVSLYAKSLYNKDTRLNVVNLGRGGYTTYHVLPTGTAIPSGVSVTIDATKNITKALSYNPIAIIVNMPSNDTNNGYSVADQIANYNVLHHEAFINNVPLWVATTQPRNFNNTTLIQRQIEVRDAILTAYPERSINFWTEIAAADGRILSNLNSGDGVHLNDSGHAILTNKVLEANLLTKRSPICAITTWNGTTWSNSLPKKSNSAIFTADYTTTEEFQACTITVQNQAILKMSSDLQITLFGPSKSN